jgi:hypothetical protein
MRHLWEYHDFEIAFLTFRCWLARVLRKAAKRIDNPTWRALTGDIYDD